MAGIECNNVQVTSKGLQYDRRWMLVDHLGKFITAREYPQLILLQPVLKIENNVLVELLIIEKFTRKLIATIIKPENPIGKIIETNVWGSDVQVTEVDTNISKILSEYLQIPLYFVYQQDKQIRPIDPKYATDILDETSLSDGYPILIVSEESLAFVQEKSGEKIEMERFRPNIVVNGLAAFEEDNLKAFWINDATFLGVKPCSRCVLTTISPQDLKKSSEPLKTLAKYRKFGNKLLFGQNLIIKKQGTIAVGNTIEPI